MGVKVGRFVSGNSPTCLLTIKSGQLSFRPTPSFLVRYPLPLVYTNPPSAITRGGGGGCRKRCAESAKHLAFLRFRFTYPCLFFAPSSTDRAILIYNISIIINRRTGCNLLLREGRTNERIFLLFSSLFFLLFFLNGRNCNNEGEDQRLFNFFPFALEEGGREEVGRGRLRDRVGRIGGKKEAQFLPAVFRFNCTRR